jgi:hypothetical protein
LPGAPSAEVGRVNALISRLCVKVRHRGFRTAAPRRGRESTPSFQAGLNAVSDG